MTTGGAESPASFWYRWNVWEDSEEFVCCMEQRRARKQPNDDGTGGEGGSPGVKYDLTLDQVVSYERPVPTTLRGLLRSK